MLDLVAIEARHKAADESTYESVELYQSLDDIPALIARVRELESAIRNLFLALARTLPGVDVEYEAVRESVKADLANFMVTKLDEVR